VLGILEVRAGLPAAAGVPDVTRPPNGPGRDQ